MPTTSTIGGRLILDDGGSQDRLAGLAAGGLILDGARSRPSYFDGKFLTAADLTRDQDYMRLRQADLARASGTGVVAGLEVMLAPDASTDVVLQPGHGVTPRGDIVTIAAPRAVRLMDLPATRRLDSKLGVRLQASEPIGRRTGLFILALRPVEFTANPVAAYPTTIDGPRGAQDGDIIEATAVTLIPYPMPDGASALDQARGLVARDVFVAGQAGGELQDVLPLAMLALDRGIIRWVDPAMVRRETGADTPLQVSMGVRPRALAEAYLVQHNQHFLDVLSGLERPSFAAATHFAALPPAGRLPAACVTIDAFGFLQSYFPPALEVDIAFSPADEIAALVEESLLLPPIDLAAGAAAQMAVGILVLVPVQRPEQDAIARVMAQGNVRARTAALAAAPAPGALPGRRPVIAGPIDLVAAAAPAADGGGGGANPPATADNAPAADPMDAWRAAWPIGLARLDAQRDGTQGLLWYVRRRTVPYRSRLEGVPAAVKGPVDVAPPPPVEPSPVEPLPEPPVPEPPPPAPAGPETSAERLARLVREQDLGEAHALNLEKVAGDADRQAAYDDLLARVGVLRAPAILVFVVTQLQRFDFDAKALVNEDPSLDASTCGLGLMRLDPEGTAFKPAALAELAALDLTVKLDAALLRAEEEVFREVSERLIAAIDAGDGDTIKPLIDKLRG